MTIPLSVLKIMVIQVFAGSDAIQMNSQNDNEDKTTDQIGWILQQCMLYNKGSKGNEDNNEDFRTVLHSCDVFVHQGYFCNDQVDADVVEDQYLQAACTRTRGRSSTIVSRRFPP